MNQYIILNYILANKRKKELEAQQIDVPSDFMTKSLIYGMVAPNMPMLGYIIIDKEAKKLELDGQIMDTPNAESAAVPGPETENPPKSVIPVANDSKSRKGVASSTKKGDTSK